MLSHKIGLIGNAQVIYIDVSTICITAPAQFAALILPAAVSFGYREQALVAILVMAGSATTVSCYVMARNMGHEGVLTASVVMLTTLLSAFTITAWIYLLRCLALI